MRLPENYKMRVLMKRAKTALGVFFILGGMVFCISCSSSRQQYSQPARGMPSSFENDVTGPPVEEEKIWSKGRSLF